MITTLIRLALQDTAYLFAVITPTDCANGNSSKKDSCQSNGSRNTSRRLGYQTPEVYKVAWHKRIVTQSTFSLAFNLRQILPC